VDAEIDRLLGVHVEPVFRALHVVDDLEVEREVAVFREMRTVEAHALLRLDDLAQQRRNALELLTRRLVRDAQREDDAPLVHAPVVAHPAREQVGVRHHDLLAGEAAQPRGLDSDVLDAAHVIAHDQEVADHERLVERDRQRGQQVPEHVLQRERDRDAADSQPSHQRGDVHAEVVEREQQHHAPRSAPARRSG